MAFFPQSPPAAYYAVPMPFPNQEFYAAMYPNGQGMDGSTLFYENNNYKKPGYNNRKESMMSTDSGISDFSFASSSRKTSSMSSASNLSVPESDLEEVEEDLVSHLEDLEVTEEDHPEGDHQRVVGQNNLL